MFDQNKYSLEIPLLFCIKPFDSSIYIRKTCSKKSEKCKTPCQSVSNNPELFDLPTELHHLWKFERVLIAKSISFKKITIMTQEQKEKITRITCNVPVDDIDISNLLLRNVDNTGLVIVKMKCKLEYGGRVLLEAVRPAFLCNILRKKP